jgi:pimeloyl-ACP methyl ester carboxylesterase
VPDTQLDQFQLVIPNILHAFTIYAIDFPGMGWSDITPRARYTEPALRRAIVEFVETLDLRDVTLAAESMGATVSLTASTELEERVRRVVAFNTYDYSGGVGRANTVASLYVGGARLPALGAVDHTNGKPARPRHGAAGRLIRSEQAPGSLPRRAPPGRPSSRVTRVAREVFRNVGSMIAARSLYGRVTAPVTLIYGEHDWSRPPEREANLALLRNPRSITLPDTGHFAALEQPDRVAEILLESV